MFIDIAVMYLDTYTLRIVTGRKSQSCPRKRYKLISSPKRFTILKCSSENAGWNVVSDVFPCASKCPTLTPKAFPRPATPSSSCSPRAGYARAFQCWHGWQILERRGWQRPCRGRLPCGNRWAQKCISPIDGIAAARPRRKHGSLRGLDSRCRLGNVVSVVVSQPIGARTHSTGCVSCFQRQML